MRFLLDPFNWDISDPNSIPSLVIQHLYITGVSLLLGLAIAVPIALLVARYRRLYGPVITTAGIVYTLPSLAVVGVLVGVRGFGLSANTVIAPLVAYTQVVLIRNIVAAIDAIDPALVEVGRAMGMSAWQVQLRVVFPLALPIVVAGLRIATVTNIGIATVGGLVGAGGLGVLVFGGISYLPNTDQIVTGAILVTVLAVGADLLLLGAQRFLSRGRAAPATV
jgi:osmoprotectant transport system permease protein